MKKYFMVLSVVFVIAGCGDTYEVNKENCSANREELKKMFPDKDEAEKFGFACLTKAMEENWK